MTLLVVCPVILSPNPHVLASWDYEHVLLIDNSPGTEDLDSQPWRDIAKDRGWHYWCSYGNLGVARSWNRAYACAQAAGYDQVALISQSFTPKLGLSHLAELVDKHADERGLLTEYAFHAICLSVKTWETIGGFDEGYYPAYWEDTTALRRMFLAGIHSPENPMYKVVIDAECATAAAMKAGFCTAEDYARNGRRYVRQHGGPPFHETFTVEWDSDSVDMSNNWASMAERVGRDPRVEGSYLPR